MRDFLGCKTLIHPQQHCLVHQRSTRAHYTQRLIDSWISVTCFFTLQESLIKFHKVHRKTSYSCSGWAVWFISDKKIFSIINCLFLILALLLSRCSLDLVSYILRRYIRKWSSTTKLVNSYNQWIIATSLIDGNSAVCQRLESRELCILRDELSK